MRCGFYLFRTLRVPILFSNKRSIWTITATKLCRRSPVPDSAKNFADPAAKAKAIQTAARNSYRLPVTVNNSVNQAMSVSIATMRALEKQIKVLDKAIEQQFAIIPNTLILISNQSF